MVLVATPNNFHKPMTIAALEAGKNVICEKPVALSSEDLADMIAASEKGGGFSRCTRTAGGTGISAW